MKCTVCGKELEDQASFCIYCGTEVSKTNWEEQKKMYRIQLDSREKERQKLSQQKDEKLKVEEELKFELENYKKLENKEYPGCYRWKEEEPTIKKNKNEEKNSKKTGKELIFLVLSIICCISVCFPWINIPAVAEILDYIGTSYSFNLFNIINLVPDVANLAADTAHSYWDAGSDMLHGLLFILLVLVLIIAIFLLFYGYYIYQLLSSQSDTNFYNYTKNASLGGMFCVGSTYLLVMFSNSWMKNYFGDYGDYMPSMMRIDAGVWIALIISVGMYVGNRIQMNNLKNQINMEAEEKNTLLQVSNYDPVLPFRIISIEIKQSYSFLVKLKILSFNHCPVDSIVGQIHIFKANGDKIVLPEMKFQTFIKAKGRESELTGQLYETKIEEDFNCLKEAKIYISQYHFFSWREEGSGYSIDSDYTIEELKNIRRQYGDNVIRKEGIYARNMMCVCGQIYDKNSNKCPLCGKVKQEEE